MSVKAFTVGYYEMLDGWFRRALKRLLRRKVPKIKFGGDVAKLYHKETFDTEVTVKEVVGSISAFSRVHVCLIVSAKKLEMNVAFPPNNDIIFLINSGSAGTANNTAMNLDIKTKQLYFYVWGHNMYPWQMDFHGNLTIYYTQS